MELKPGRSVRQAIQDGDIPPHVVGAVSVDSSTYDPLERSIFAWFSVEQDWYLTIDSETHIMLKQMRSDRYKVILRRKGKPDEMAYPNLLSLSFGQGVAEDYARKAKSSLSRRDAPWRSDPASPRQILMLQNIDQWQPGTTKGEASDILNQWFAANPKSYRKRKTN
jgi:hypothetical protein